MDQPDSIGLLLQGRVTPTCPLPSLRSAPGAHLLTVCRLEPWLEQWDELKEASCNAYSDYDNGKPGAESGSQAAGTAVEDKADGKAEPEQKHPEDMQHEPEKQDSALDNEQERMQRSSTAQQPKSGTFGKQTWDNLWGRLSYR